MLRAVAGTSRAALERAYARNELCNVLSSVTTQYVATTACDIIALSSRQRVVSKLGLEIRHKHAAVGREKRAQLCDKRRVRVVETVGRHVLRRGKL